MRGLRLFCFCVAFVSTAARSPGTAERPDNDFIEGNNPNNEIIGIASVAGITTRNGRISSLGGFKIIPNSNTRVYGNKGYFPLTVVAEKDGRYASGTVQVYPGFVSSSARAGFGPPNSEPASTNGYGLPSHISRPFKEFFRPSPEVFAPMSLENLFPNDLFKSYFPPQNDVLRNNWLYPTFNPFMNFWR